MRPDPQDVKKPWVIRTCKCAPLTYVCETCDGAGWYFYNTETRVSISDMKRDALERHG